MSVFHEVIKQRFADVDKFLRTTLKDENLSKVAKKEKDKLLDSLQKLYDDYDVLNPNIEEGSSTSSKGVSDESRFTTGSTHSHGSHGSDEDASSDNIPYTTVKALTEPTKLGYLQKKPTGFKEKFSKGKRYCVIHKNVMYWFKKPTDKKHEGAIILTGFTFKDLSVNDKEFIFELSAQKKKSYQFQADTKGDLDEWKMAIETAAGFVEEIIEEDDDLDDVYDEVGNVAEGMTNKKPPVVAEAADKKPPTTTTLLATVPPPNATPKPPALPSIPHPQSQSIRRPPPPEPSSPELEYSDGVSMVDAVVKPEKKDDKGDGKSQIPTPLIEEDDDDSLIYEFVEPPPSESAAPKPSPVSNQGPPPLPSRSGMLPPPPTQKLPDPPVEKKVIRPSLDNKSLLEDYENLFYGKWACRGTSDNELTFDRGDVIHILNRDLDADQWWIGERCGHIGLVPKTYLTPAYELMVA